MSTKYIILIYFYLTRIGSKYFLHHCFIVNTVALNKHIVVPLCTKYHTIIIVYGVSDMLLSRDVKS